MKNALVSAVSPVVERLEERRMLAASISPRISPYDGGLSLSVIGGAKADTITVSVVETQKGFNLKVGLNSVKFWMSYDLPPQTNPDVSPGLNVYVNGGGGDDVITTMMFTQNPHVWASVYGSKGNDRITSAATNTTPWLDGGAGDDKIKVIGTGSDRPTVVHGGIGNDVITAFYDAPLNAYCDAGNDTVYGSGGDDQIHGGSGNDVLYGGDGSNVFFGGSGKDIIYGGDDNDTYYTYHVSPDSNMPAKIGADSFDGGDGDNQIYRYPGDVMPKYDNVDNIYDMSDFGGGKG